MSVQVELDIEGDREFSRRLETIPKNISNWRKPLFRIGGELRGAIDQNFSSRGATFGESWKPRVKNQPWPILEKTGLMRRGFNQRLGMDSLIISNKAPHFKYHQSNKPRRVLPRRVMMKIDRTRQQFIQKEFQKHVQNSITKG